VDLTSKWKKGLRILRHHGPWGLGLYAARRILWLAPGADVKRLFLYVLREPREVAASVAAARGHEFRFAEAAEVRALHADPRYYIRDDVMEAFGWGHRCFLQRDGDTVVGFSWVAARPLAHLAWGIHVNLPEDTAYVYKGFTLPPYRGQGFQALRHVRILEHLRREGRNALFVYVDHLNLDSQKGLCKSGYRRVGRLTAIRREGRMRFRLRVGDGLWTDAARV